MDSPVSGDTEPRLLIITGFPNKEEAYAEEMNKGKAKRKLLSMMARAGVPADRVAFAPLLCWRPKSDREPTQTEVETCREHLAELVDDLRPNCILTMGVPAVEGCHEPMSLYLRRGDLVKSRVFGTKMIATFAPGIVLRTGEWDKQTVIEHDLRRAWEQAQTSKWPLMLGDDYFVCTSPDEVKAALDYLRERPIVAYDIETTSLDMFEDKDEILCVQVSSKEGEGFVFPLRGAWARHESDVYADWQIEHGTWRTATNSDGETRRVLYDRESLKAHERDKRRHAKVWNPAFPKGSVVCDNPDAHNPYSDKYEKKDHICHGTPTDVLAGPLEPCTALGRMNGKMVPRDYNIIVGLLKDFLESDVPKSGHNLNFDNHGLRWQLGIRVRNVVFDSILAYHIIHEEWPHDLDFVRSILTWMPRYNIELKSHVPSKKHSFALVPNEVLWTYGAADADCEYRIIAPLREWLARDNPDDGEWLLNNIAVPLQRTLVQIEENGILINRQRLDDLSEWYRRKIDALRVDLAMMCDDDKLTPLDRWSNDNDLREWLFNTTYERVVKKATKHVCKTCHGNADPTHPDYPTMDECDDCVDGKIPGRDAETVEMHGIGFPVYMAWLSKKTKEPSTGKKTFAALKAWCREEFKYKFKVVGERKDGTPIEKRVITTTPLSNRERTRRTRMAQYLDLLEQLKKCIKAKNQFLDGDDTKDVIGAKALLKHIKSDGRVHTHYNQLVETARLSSRDPNLQNVSNVGECTIHQPQGIRCTVGCPGEYRHYSIRSMYTVPEGSKWMAADYRSEEVRIMAYLSGDMKLLEATMTCYGEKGVGGCGLVFLPTDDDPDRPLKMLKHERDTGHVPADVHQWVAAQVFGVEYEKVTKEQRRQCKSVTFGIAYGQTEMGLADALGWTPERARELIDLYFKTFPQLALYQRSCARGTALGVDAVNALGRKRHTVGPVEMKPYVREWEWKKVVNAMARERLNYPTQSSAADIISLDAIALFDVWGYEDGENTVAHKLGRKICDGTPPAFILRDLGVKCIDEVHDAFEMECPEENIEAASRVIEDVMVGLPWRLLGWYLPVDISVGRYWDDVGNPDEWGDVRYSDEDAANSDEVQQEEVAA